jgi:hypothetical protein
MSLHENGAQRSAASADMSGDHKRTARLAYLRFAAMILTSAVVMYVVMYFNTYSIDHVYFSWTRVFMTMMSAATMALIMLFFMRGMYRNPRLNAVVIGAAVVAFGAGLRLVRSQAPIGDVAWMEAMIPHHSIAILTRAGGPRSDVY